MDGWMDTLMMPAEMDSGKRTLRLLLRESRAEGGGASLHLVQASPHISLLFTD